MSDILKRALHTAWQAFIAVFVPLVSSIHSVSTAKAAVVAAAGAALGAVLSALKTAFLASKLAALIKAKLQLKSL